jgi:small conductance mechanosensitive channel
MCALEEQSFTLPEPIYRLRFDQQVNTALLSALGSQRISLTAGASREVKKVPSTPTVERGDDVLDVPPDKHLEQKVDAEIQSERGNDLLDKDVPHE